MKIFFLPALCLASGAVLAQVMLYPVPSRLPAEATAPAVSGGAAQAGGAGAEPMAGASLKLETEAAGRTRHQNGYTWECGGVGADEAARMKDAALEHDLLLDFSTRGGAHLAGVEVEISDLAGRHVLQARCDGPLMLVDVPGADSYRILARKGKEVRSRMMELPAPAGGAERTLSLVLPGE